MLFEMYEMFKKYVIIWDVLDVSENFIIWEVLGDSHPLCWAVNMEYPSLPLLPGLLWPGVVVLVRVLPIGQIKPFHHLTVCKQITDVKLNC